MHKLKPSLSFFEDEREIASLIRKKNWHESPLGPVENWTSALTGKLNTIIHSPFPMFLMWGEALTVFYNDAFRPLIGDLHSCIGKPAEEACGAHLQHIYEPARRVLEDGRAIALDNFAVAMPVNGKQLEMVWTVSLSPVTDDENNIAGVVAICVDNTEKVKLISDLKEANDLCTFAIDASELGTWDYNPASGKFTANRRLKDWFGLSEEEQVDLKAAIEAIVVEDRQGVMSAIENALKNETGGKYEARYRITNKKTGELRFIEAKGKATFDNRGNALRLNGTLRDVTAGVRAEERNRKLLVLVQNSVDLMSILELDGTNSYINPAGKALLGIPEDADVATIPISDFHTPKQLEFVEREIIANVMAKGKWSGQFEIKHVVTGDIIPLYNNCHRIDDPLTGKPIGVGAIMRDMRSELKTKGHLEQQVHSRERALSQMNEQLRKKNQDLASFAFVSSHDLQEPLRKIITFISRIEEHDGSIRSERNAAYFERIKTAAKRMQTLITDLLAFARLEGDINEKQFEPVDFSMMLQEIVSELREKIEARRGTVSSVNLPVVRAIPFQIRQLLYNLLSNAVKFSKADVPLEIRVEGEFVKKYGLSSFKLSVSDNGIGFEQEFTEKVFTAFQRLHARDEYEGSGIGLAICRRIMDDHKGTISARSEHGAGTTFEMIFPVDR